MVNGWARCLILSKHHSLTLLKDFGIDLDLHLVSIIFLFGKFGTISSDKQQLGQQFYSALFPYIKVCRPAGGQNCAVNGHHGKRSGQKNRLLNIFQRLPFLDGY